MRSGSPGDGDKKRFQSETPAFPIGNTTCPHVGTTVQLLLLLSTLRFLEGDAPDFVEVGEAGIAVGDAMRRERRVQLVG